MRACVRVCVVRFVDFSARTQTARQRPCSQTGLWAPHRWTPQSCERWGGRMWRRKRSFTRNAWNQNATWILSGIPAYCGGELDNLRPSNSNSPSLLVLLGRRIRLLLTLLLLLLSTIVRPLPRTIGITITTAIQLPSRQPKKRQPRRAKVLPTAPPKGPIDIIVLSNYFFWFSALGPPNAPEGRKDVQGSPRRPKMPPRGPHNSPMAPEDCPRSPH